MKRRTIRQIARILVLSFSVPLLTGCWDRREINDLAIVLAAGVDEGEKGEVELTVQIYVPSGKEGTGSSGGTVDANRTKGQTTVSTAKGRSLADAMSHTQERLSRKLFWGHSDVFVFGRKRAQTGINDDLDFILRFGQMRERADVYVTGGKAVDIMKILPRLERSSMEALRELSKLEVSTEIDLKTIVQNMIENPEQTFFLPYVQAGSEISDEHHLHKTDMSYFNGVGIFKRGVMVGHVDDDLTRGVFWLTNRIKSSVITLTPEDSEGTVSINLISTSTTFHPHIDRNGKWQLVVSIVGMADVIENTTKLDLMKPDNIKLINQGASDLIRDRIERALKQIQMNMKADIFGMGESFRRHYPKHWKQAKMKWDELFPQVDIDANVKIRIIHMGIVSPNISTLNPGEEK